MVEGGHYLKKAILFLLFTRKQCLPGVQCADFDIYTCKLSYSSVRQKRPRFYPMPCPRILLLNDQKLTLDPIYMILSRATSTRAPGFQWREDSSGELGCTVFP